MIDEDFGLVEHVTVLFPGDVHRTVLLSMHINLFILLRVNIWGKDSVCATNIRVGDSTGVRGHQSLAITGWVTKCLCAEIGQKSRFCSEELCSGHITLLCVAVDILTADIPAAFGLTWINWSSSSCFSLDQTLCTHLCRLGLSKFIVMYIQVLKKYYVITIWPHMCGKGIE